MKLRGQRLSGRNRQRVQIARGDELLEFEVQALPLGFERRLADRGIERPVPPTRVLRERGRMVRDETGQAVVVPDAEDADYRRRLEEYARRVVCLELAEGLRGDPSVAFETPEPPDKGDWAAYADAIYAELQAAGFSDGDLVALVRGVHRASNLTADAVREATDGFFSRRPEPTS